jgi:hypothetical protein
MHAVATVVNWVTVPCALVVLVVLVIGIVRAIRRGEPLVEVFNDGPAVQAAPTAFGAALIGYAVGAALFRAHPFQVQPAILATVPVAVVSAGIYVLLRSKQHPLATRPVLVIALPAVLGFLSAA